MYTVFHSNQKLENLKAEIDMNMCPNIIEAGGSPQYCFGDLETIGYAVREKESAGGMCMNIRWKYTGPNCINTHYYGVMYTGDATEWIEKDYS